jgi:hypothetical protein
MQVTMDSSLVYNEPDEPMWGVMAPEVGSSRYNTLTLKYPNAKMIVGNVTQNGYAWLNTFKSLCAKLPYAWGIHAYTGSATKPIDVQKRIEDTHEAIGGTFWITEWADIHGIVDHDNQMMDWLNSTGWIERWAYFTNRASGQESWWIPGWKPQLWNMDGAITEVGEWWEESIIRSK